MLIYLEDMLVAIAMAALALGCSRRPTSTAEVPRVVSPAYSIAVMPFTQPTDACQLIMGRIPENQGCIDNGTLALLDADLRDLLEIRLMVEPMAAYYAAKRATEEELERIEALCRRIEELDADGKSVLREEQDFHNAIAMASHNRVMEQLLPVINKSILADVHYFKVGVTFSLQDHHQIVQYLRARNAEGAKTVMRLHIIHAYQVSGQTIE